MALIDALNADLKTAMLARDSFTTDTLKGIKTALQYAATPPSAEGIAALSEEQVISILQKEAKKRQESADMYAGAGVQDKADKELAEKAIIAKYLPEQLSEDDVKALVDAEVAKLTDAGNAPGPQQMGQLISAVKAASKGQADGALIARLVKERLQ